MKKILLAAIALLGLNVATFAQAVPAKKPEPAKQAKVVKMNTPAAKPATQVPVAKPAPAPAKPVVAAGTHVKKDGTPDKRYSENKRLKKDGTPDKRYKENKKSS